MDANTDVRNRLTNPCFPIQKTHTSDTVHLNTFLHLLNSFSAIHKYLLTGEKAGRC